MVSDGMQLIVTHEWDAWIDGFGELSSGPSDEMIDEWRHAGEALFGAADMLVHVVTGRLKASGSMTVEEGQYGVEAVLLYEADYAVHEHDRGGSHSWIDLAWQETEDLFQDALEKGWVRTVESWK